MTDVKNRLTAQGSAELRQTLGRSRGILAFVSILSVFVNLLMLTGPLFMLQIYGNVLTSRSEATLFALTALVAFLYGIMSILDFTRGRLLSRVGARFQSALDQRVFQATLEANMRPASALLPERARGVQDLESVQRLLSSPILSACFDIPFTPVFLAGLWFFHPYLGTLAMLGGGFLIVLTLISTRVSRRPVLEAQSAGVGANRMAERLQNDPEMVQSLGMQGTAFVRWKLLRRDALNKTLGSGDVVARFSSSTKSLRLFLQSAMLAMGAWLVLRGELSPGAMIAGSILMGRALAPIEQAIGNWAVVQQGRKGWDSLAILLSQIPAETPKTALPKPQAKLQVKQLTVVPPGETQAALKQVSFEMKPGQALGVIGPSGSGKSSLARTLSGVWKPAGGHLRLDGATLDQYGTDALGRHIGYLPQRVELFDGTISENIAGLSQNPDPEAVVAAAQKAAAHQVILNLPNGYDTKISTIAGRLSGGQVQRIGLARALFGDPVLVILDEPNSNLDNEGSQAVNRAIKTLKSEGRAVMIMAHRPAAIQECDTLLMMENGQARAFGPKDEVLKSVVQNHKSVTQNTGQGGVS
ncbi:type I secretion system permease/ATPase [Halocynthiibacter sp.]|uniref:type I secretion system permease/ATPase n=1 Tax=Halocynthiibacter sp. TaxID=1979210 RepID=UPI003C5FDD29